MARTCWLLIETPAGYRLAKPGADGVVGDVATSRDADPREIAAAVYRTLQEQGYRGEPLVLGIASQTALAATIPYAGRRMARNRQALAYALEEFLPLAAEEMGCDFVLFDHDALGVAVAVSALRPVLSALEELGVPIVSVVPVALLALQHQVEGGKPQGRRILVWQQGDLVDLFELIDGRPHVWRTIPAGVEIVQRELGVFQLGSDAPRIAEVWAWNLSDELLEAVRRATAGIPTSAERKPLEPAAAETAAAVVSGRRQPWIELHRGQLGPHDPHRPIRGPLRLLAAATACGLLLLSAAAWVRAERYQRLAEAYQQPQVEIFQRLYPGNRVPVGISARLQSEHRKLAGTSGRLEGTPRLCSAARLLHDALTPLPEQLRSRLLEIRLEENRVYLDGEVRRHGDADLLADALRKSGFTVDAPRTENLADKGVAVTITATQPSGGPLDVLPNGRAGENHPQSKSSSP